MYWNSIPAAICCVFERLTLTWDVLKSKYSQFFWNCSMININMRCIEIFLERNIMYNFYKININMRCIEILLRIMTDMRILLININMRCIEICLKYLYLMASGWLTLTWDVLKYLKGRCGVKSAPLININMRCIEIGTYQWWKIWFYD